MGYKEGHKDIVDINVYANVTDPRIKVLGSIIMRCMKSSFFSVSDVIKELKEGVEKAEVEQKVGSKRRRDPNQNDPMARLLEKMTKKNK